MQLQQDCQMSTANGPILNIKSNATSFPGSGMNIWAMALLVNKGNASNIGTKRMELTELINA
jgi:hypothetical protein